MAEPDYKAQAPTKAAIVGCGVIGAAWASRFVLSGVDVAISDPSDNLSLIHI